MILNNPLIRRSGLWPVLVMLASLASAKGPTDGQLFKEYMESAAKGDGDAIYSVGFCYWHGIGVAKNPVEAYAYWNLRGMSERVDARYALQVLEEEKEVTPEIRARPAAGGRTSEEAGRQCRTGRPSFRQASHP